MFLPGENLPQGLILTEQFTYKSPPLTLCLSKWAYYAPVKIDLALFKPFLL